MRPIERFTQYASAIEEGRTATNLANRIVATHKIFSIANGIVQAGYHTQMEKLFDGAAKDDGRRSLDDRELYANCVTITNNISELLMVAAKGYTEFSGSLDLLSQIATSHLSETDERDRLHLQEMLERGVAEGGPGMGHVLKGTMSLPKHESESVNFLVSIVSNDFRESHLLKEAMPSMN